MFSLILDNEITSQFLIMVDSVLFSNYYFLPFKATLDRLLQQEFVSTTSRQVLVSFTRNKKTIMIPLLSDTYGGILLRKPTHIIIKGLFDI
jgi:hypothetical protein